MKLVRFLWKFSWIVTLPVVSIFLYWGCGTIDRYLTFEVRHSHYSKSGSFRLLHVGAMEFNHLLRSSYLSLMSLDAPAHRSKLETVYLFVSDSDIAKLNSHLPHSGTSYVKGGIISNDKITKIKLKYRGDSIYHWGYYKKSFRVKTSKNNLYKGMRKFNIIAPRSPEIINNYLSYRLGKRMGLISPYVEMVNLVVNGSYEGVFILTEQLDESTLRFNGMMPGDLYSGELVLQDSYSGITNDIFKNPILWEKMAINNHNEKNSKKPIEVLTALLKKNQSEEIQNALAQLLDIEAFAKYNALEILSGTAHVDNAHNWRLYFDPMRSRFFPVVWDLVGWLGRLELSDGSPRIDVITSSLHVLLHKNGNFLRARQKAINSFFSSGEDLLFLEEVDNIIDELKLNIHRDPNIAAEVKSLNDEDVHKSLENLKNKIIKVFDWTRKAYVDGVMNEDILFSSNDIGIYSISISGLRPVNSLKFNFKNKISYNNKIDVNLTYWVGNRKKTIDVSDCLKINHSSLDLYVSFIQGFSMKIESMLPGRVRNNRLKTFEGYFEIKFSGLGKNNSIFEILVDRGNGEFIRAKPSSDINRRSFDELYQIVNLSPVNSPDVWSGEVSITKTTVLTNDLIIEPGTTISFTPGSSLILHSRMVAQGNSRNKIRFLPAKKNQAPWGAVVLQGKRANGSRLEYVEFSGGSGMKDDLVEYTAMFSVHDVKGVEVINCVFRDSKITDDMVHTVYSEVRFSDSLFERSLMDALDIDISDVVIERCHFIDSGNDSIDLMASNAIVLDTIIENSGDKAASVGEGSHLLAINNLAKDNVIGVQVKDGSAASLYNLDLIDNDHALDAYKKNWRYDDGGNIYLYKSRLVGNQKMITADKNSAIYVYDSYVDKPLETKKKQIMLADTVDNNDNEIARSKMLSRQKEEIEIMKEFESRYWDRIDPSRRGALNVASH